MSKRVYVLRHLGSFLSPEGRLIMTTMCSMKDASMQAMDLWSTMTEGCGPLPHPEQVHRQLEEAGFGNIQIENLIPGFFYFKQP